MLPLLSEYLIGKWDELFPGSLKPTTINYLGIPGSVQGRTTTFLGFTGQSGLPMFAVKIYRDALDQAIALNEKEILFAFKGKSKALEGSVPRIIACEQFAGHWALVQTIVNGKPMMADLTAHGTPEIRSSTLNMQLALDWLVRFNTEVRTIKRGVSLTEDSHELQQIQRFKDTFELSELEKEYLVDLAETLGRHMRESGLRVIRHGDYCRHNMLVTSGMNGATLGVIDWTFAQKDALPLHDMFFFLTTYFLQIRKQHGLEGYKMAFSETFFAPSEYGQLVRRIMFNGCRSLGISLEYVRVLFPMFLIEQALFEYDQIVRCSKGGCLPRFALTLSASEDKGFSQALKEQLWVCFFHEFVKSRDLFVID